LCLLRGPSKVLQVSPTGRNGHHCCWRESAARSGRSRGLASHVWRVWIHPCSMCEPQKRAPGSSWCRRVPERGSWDGRQPVTVVIRFTTSQDATIFGSSADYVKSCLASNVLTVITVVKMGLPRCDTGRCWVGVRPILENSTACQKSMPSLISVLFGVAFGLFWVLPGFSLV